MISRSKLALVPTQGSVAILSDVVVTTKNWNQGERLIYGAMSTFSDRTLKQVSNVILPLVDSITDPLGIPKKSFQIELSNPNLSSSLDRSITVSGFSADLPIFLAMLGAACQLGDVPSSILATGHIKNSTGEIGMVKGLDTKANAASIDPTIDIFIHPNVESDSITDLHMPQRAQRVKTALRVPTGSVRLMAVNTVKEVLGKIWSDSSIFLGALRCGYFGNSPEAEHEGAFTHLFCRNESHLFGHLRELWMSDEGRQASVIFQEFLMFQLRAGNYPAEIGRKLLSTLCSLPTTAVRQHIAFPLIANELIAQIQSLAQDQKEDFSKLVSAVLGDFLSSPDHPKISAQLVLKYLLQEFDRSKLAKNLDQPLDLARGTFVLSKVTVQSEEEFANVLVSFMLHLSGGTEQADFMEAECSARELVEQVFHREGGWRAAQAEALSGIRGGLRFILDQLIDQMKLSRREKHIDFLLRRNILSKDIDFRIAFVEAFFQHFRNWIPDRYLNQPEEQFADDPASLIKSSLQVMWDFEAKVASY